MDEVTTIPKLRRVYKDTKANLDALTDLKDEDLAYGTDTLILYRQNGNGAANWEAITPDPATLSKNATCSYTGNDTVNRAIAHGLGRTPKIIVGALYVSSGEAYIYIIISGLNYIIHNRSTTAGGLAVTAPDATNFYVGNATEYTYSANHTGETYYWVAIG